LLLDTDSVLDIIVLYRFQIITYTKIMSIKFNNKQTKVDDENIYSIEIYRGSDDKDNQHFSYVDSMHPMNISELQKLKNYLSELIWEEFNN